MADIRLTQHGTIDMIGCLSREAFEFMVEHTAADALWLGRSIAVEPRFTANSMAAASAITWPAFSVRPGFTIMRTPPTPSA